MNDVAILNQYPKTQYNSLIPITTIQQVSDMHKIIVNQVQLDINNDAYYDKQTKKYPLKKQAILKLMAAANIRIKESKSIKTQAFIEAMEMARAIGKQVDYDKRDVAHQVTLEVPDMNGGYREVTGTKEIVFEELPDTGQTREMLKHKRAHCETKALLRALRAAMMLKSAYDKADFDKPFIVAIIVPNTDNQEVKKVMLDKFAQSNNVLFGINEEPLQIENQSHDMVEEFTELEVIEDDDLPDILKDEPQSIYCDDCGVEVTDTTKNSREEVLASSQKLFGSDLCPTCQRNRAAKAKGEQ